MYCARNTDDFYRPQRSCGQGNVFTGVCLSTGGGGCLPQCMLGCHTLPRDQGDPPAGPGRPHGTRETPPGPGRPPRDQADTPPGPGRPPHGTRETPPGPGRHPPPGSRLQHTVYERPVRILLECILVLAS